MCSGPWNEINTAMHKTNNVAAAIFYMLQHFDNHREAYWAGLVCSIWKQKITKLNT